MRTTRGVARLVLLCAALAACGDNDHPGGEQLLVSPTTGLHTSEGAGTASFMVMLTAKPEKEISVAITSSNTNEGVATPPMLTISPDRYNIPQPVTIVGVDDNIADGPQPYTIELTADGLRTVDVGVTNDDNDSAQVLVSPEVGLMTTEAGGQATFTVVLGSAPANDVTCAMSSSDLTEGTIDKTSLTFTHDNWNAPQTVTITGVEDSIADGPIAYTIVMSPCVSTDPLFNDADPDDVAVTNIDDDSPGFIVTPTSGLQTTEAGGTDEFTVVLTSQPAADVTVTVTSSDVTEALPSVASLTFTTLNWNAPQTVTVTGIDDHVADGDQAYTIVLGAATSGDPGYAGVDPSDVLGLNLDNDSAGFLVAPTSGLHTTEAGGQDQFAVVLLSQPTADVTVAVASNDPGEGVASPATLTFTSANWNAPQLVTVTGQNDFIADGNQLYTIVTSPAVSADAQYSGLDPDDVQAINLDDDSPGITVSPITGLVTTEGGGTAEFNVVLQSQPTANVIIPLSVSDSTEGSVAPSQLVFTPLDWNAPQIVPVTGKDDAIADGDQPYTVITGAAVSTDPEYSGLDPANVSVTNLDNDSAGVLVNPTSGLTTTEAGGTATFTVVLLSQPTQNVTIPVSSSDTTEGTVSTSLLTFTPVNWNAPQTVTVKGVNDFIADGNQPYTIVLAAATSLDPGYSGRNPQDVSVTNLDNDSPGIRVTPTSGLTTTEAGGTATFTIVLLSQPLTNVTIALSSSKPGEGTPSPASVTFTPVNWNAPQTVTVTGVDDSIADGDQPYTIVTAPATSIDPGYSGRDAADVSVTNLDNDIAGIIVAPTSGLVTSEAGTTDTFTIVLRSQPTAGVTIPLSSSNLGEGTVSPTSVTFTAANWNAPQTVTVKGVDDAVVDGNQTYLIFTGAAISTDPKYAGIDPADVGVTNLDNDAGGILVSPTSGLVTTEAGGSDVFSVVLLSKPTANVTINLSSSDPTEGTIVPTTLTFTPANWNQAQSVTVTGVDDVLADGNVVYQVVTAPATSADPSYNGLDASDVTVTNTDNDVAGFTVDPTSGLQVSELGDSDTFTIVLNTQPSANVTVALSSSDTTEGTVSPASVTFTPVNWAAPQTVTVTGVNDNIADGNQVFSIITGAATSADPAYNGMNPPNVSVTNLDNETPQVYVKAHPKLKTSESGQQATIRVMLTVAPTANVTCTVASSDTTEGTVSPTTLTFTPANFGSQTVTVKGVDDAIVDGDQLYTVVFSACTSTDPNYSGFDPRDVSVVNRDND